MLTILPLDAIQVILCASAGTVTNVRSRAHANDRNRTGRTSDAAEDGLVRVPMQHQLCPYPLQHRPQRAGIAQSSARREPDVGRGMMDKDDTAEVCSQQITQNVFQLFSLLSPHFSIRAKHPNRQSRTHADEREGAANPHAGETGGQVVSRQVRLSGCRWASRRVRRACCIATCTSTRTTTSSSAAA